MATVDPPKFSVTDTPVHTTRSATGVILGVGLTLMAKVRDGPLHPLLKGVTVNCELIGVLKIFEAVNGLMLPVPVIELIPILLLV